MLIKRQAPLRKMTVTLASDIYRGAAGQTKPANSGLRGERHPKFVVPVFVVDKAGDLIVEWVAY